MKYLHTMIRVGDLEKSLDFYCTKLGLVQVRKTESEKGRYTLVFLASSEDLQTAKEKKAPLLELTYNWDKEDYSGGRNFGHLAYAVDNIYDFCQKLMNDGVELNRPPRDGHMAFIKSPDGISIEILQRGASLAIKEPWKSMKNIKTW